MAPLLMELRPPADWNTVDPRISARQLPPPYPSFPGARLLQARKCKRPAHYERWPRRIRPHLLLLLLLLR